jgi:hypothetical protein
LDVSCLVVYRSFAIPTYYTFEADKGLQLIHQDATTANTVPLAKNDGFRLFHWVRVRLIPTHCEARLIAVPKA